MAPVKVTEGPAARLHCVTLINQHISLFQINFVETAFAPILAFFFIFQSDKSLFHSQPHITCSRMHGHTRRVPLSSHPARSCSHRGQVVRRIGNLMTTSAPRHPKCSPTSIATACCAQRLSAQNGIGSRHHHLRRNSARRSRRAAHHLHSMEVLPDPPPNHAHAARQWSHSNHAFRTAVRHRRGRNSTQKYHAPRPQRSTLLQSPRDAEPAAGWDVDAVRMEGDGDWDQEL